MLTNTTASNEDEQRNKQILAIAEAIRVAYLRGTRDPQKLYMTETIYELRDFLIEALKNTEGVE